MAKAIQKFVVTCSTHRSGGSYSTQAKTISELIEHFAYTLDCGASYSHEKGNAKINKSPKNIDSLVKNLNNAVNNSAANGYAGKTYSAVLSVDTEI